MSDTVRNEVKNWRKLYEKLLDRNSAGLSREVQNWIDSDSLYWIDIELNQIDLIWMNLFDNWHE
jgi:hypothetical protein